MAITKRRVVRALCARLSRAALVAINSLVPEKRQQCNACSRSTVGFWTYEGRPFGCPYCNASSRERFVLYAISKGKLRVPVNGRALHVAPSERAVYNVFYEACDEYICADLHPGVYRNSDVVPLDITTLSMRDDLGQFDVIYASHVLEHIPNLKAALEGIHNRLSIGGQAWFLFPIGSGPTEEDLSVSDPREREARFGQWDHVRSFGEDAEAIIKRSGFDVEVLYAGSLSGKEVDLLGLDSTDKIFVCSVNSHVDASAAPT